MLNLRYEEYCIGVLVVFMFFLCRITEYLAALEQVEWKTMKRELLRLSSMSCCLGHCTCTSTQHTHEAGNFQKIKYVKDQYIGETNFLVV